MKALSVLCLILIATASSWQHAIGSFGARQVSFSRLQQAHCSAPATSSGKWRVFDVNSLHGKLNRDFAAISLPAFVALIADPLASFVDAVYVGRLGASEQAAMGIATSTQYSIAKLYNDPLMKTTTSLIAGKAGDELEASAATAIITAVLVGAVQSLLFMFAGNHILSMMGVKAGSEMLGPAVEYLKWRGLGVPAATVLLVTNGIFRGLGDTRTPLLCTLLGSVLNILLDPILIFGFGMGCAGAGAATAIAQWATAIPLLFLLNQSIPIKITGRDRSFYKNAASSYYHAGSLVFIRTVAKVAAYAVTASAAARLGTTAMAAYSITFNLGFATSQLCESVAIAAQSLLARSYPFDTLVKRRAAEHVMRLALLSGTLISGGMTAMTLFNQNSVLGQLTMSPEVRTAAAAVMPAVLLTQFLKGWVYSTAGIILGGLDWFWSSVSVQAAALVCVVVVSVLPPSLSNVWLALAAFMGTQVRLM